MHRSRRRIPRRGLEFNVCIINKSSHTKQSLETYLMIRVFLDHILTLWNICFNEIKLPWSFFSDSNSHCILHLFSFLAHSVSDCSKGVVSISRYSLRSSRGSKFLKPFSFLQLIFPKVVFIVRWKAAEMNMLSSVIWALMGHNTAETTWNTYAKD